MWTSCGVSFLTIDDVTCWRKRTEDFHYEFGLFCDFDTFSWTSRIEEFTLRQKATMEGNLIHYESSVTPCQLWQGSRDTDGYGLKQVDGRLYKAHRIAWQMANGQEIPDGLQVLHICDVRECLNPEHLFLGTLLDNMTDRNTKQRQAFLQGEAHARHKLTDKEVREIRHLWANGATSQELGARYGVHPSTAHRAATGRRWKHLPCE